MLEKRDEKEDEQIEKRNNAFFLSSISIQNLFKTIFIYYSFIPCSISKTAISPVSLRDNVLTLLIKTFH